MYLILTIWHLLIIRNVPSFSSIFVGEHTTPTTKTIIIKIKYNRFDHLIKLINIIEIALISPLLLKLPSLENRSFTFQMLEESQMNKDAMQS